MHRCIDVLVLYTKMNISLPYLFRFWWLLGFIENGIKAFIETAPHTRVLWGRVVLEQTQELHREPWGWHKVVGVVLQICVACCHNLWSKKFYFHYFNFSKK